MTLPRRGAALATLTAILIALLTLTIYALTRLSALHLPIPTSTALLPLLLPLLSLALLALTLRRAAVPRLEVLLATLYTLSLLDTASLTLAASALDPRALDCALETTWRAWFEAKQTPAVRGVQDALQCCGLRSTRDKAWPFPDATHGVEACREAFGREVACWDPWRAATGRCLGLMVAVAAGSLVLKVLVVVVFRVRREFPAASVPAWYLQGSERRGLLEAQPERSEGEERYTDEETTA